MLMLSILFHIVFSQIESEMYVIIELFNNVLLLRLIWRLEVMHYEAYHASKNHFRNSLSFFFPEASGVGRNQGSLSPLLEHIDSLAPLYVPVVLE